MYTTGYSTLTNTYFAKHLFPHSPILQLNCVRLAAFSTGGHGLHVQNHT